MRDTGLLYSAKLSGMAGFEPTASTLTECRSTTELHAINACSGLESNQQPTAYKAVALPIVLPERAADIPLTRP